MVYSQMVATLGRRKHHKPTSLMMDTGRKRPMAYLLVLLVIWMTALPVVLVDGSTLDHRYAPGEEVELWVNKVRVYRIEKHARTK